MPGNIFAIKIGGQKITSPITKAFHSSLLQDKFDSKGVEPLNSQNKRISLEASDATAPSSSAATMDIMDNPKTEAETKGLTSRFLHLPRECQSEILSHVGLLHSARAAPMRIRGCDCYSFRRKLTVYLSRPPHKI
jgi:hypothetical protein